jgi:hypothetical protein
MVVFKEPGCKSVIGKHKNKASSFTYLFHTELMPLHCMLRGVHGKLSYQVTNVR